MVPDLFEKWDSYVFNSIWGGKCAVSGIMDQEQRVNTNKTKVEGQ